MASHKFSPQEQFGKILLLMMMSENYQDWTLADINRLVLAPMLKKQYFIFLEDDGAPVCFATYARLTKLAADGYISGKRKLQPEDWDAGDQLWFIDFVAPYGGVGHYVRQIKERFPNDRQAFTRRCKNGEFKRVGLFERRLVA